MTDQRPNGDAGSMDPELARLVVDHGLATHDEVTDCRAALEQVSQEGKEQSLAAVMIDLGVVTRNQIDRLKTSIEETRRGQQIPGYRILEKLGAGAMAVVFKAKQLSLDRTVAIKILPKQFSENAEYVGRFYREGKAAAKLNHPNIVQAIDVGEANGRHYFVMEYVEGRSLYEDLVTGKVFSEDEALRIIMQISRALEHAHGQGLIHRDVKPKNIMIAQDGTAKLADMGLARIATDAEAARAEAGRAYGTPYYISPEQIRGEVDVDFRADIYSLGATLYHLVTGRVPFEGPTPAAVMHKHLKEPLLPPDHINTKLSSGLGEVVEGMMAKDRELRYGSTSDLLMDLETIAAGEPPLQARRQIRADVLTQLTEGASSRDLIEQPPAVPTGTMLAIIIMLAAALIASLILNVFQWVGRAP